MKCPLMRIPITVKGVADREKIDDCIKEECAWWNKDREVCSIKLVAGSVYDLWYKLTQIEEKLHQNERTRERP